MAGKKVIIRTLDIGADKQVDYFHLDKEDNPAMGYRAIRICLDRRDVFKTQLRALYRALPEQEMQYFMNYYTLLKSRIKLPKSFSREAIIALLRIIFLDLYNDFENYINHRNNTSTTRKEDLTHRFYTLMMDNYREHKEVIFYADKLHVSSKYLSEVVKETSGKSPKDWIIDYSLLEIKELLKNSSLNIQEITIRTKFLNQSALGRFFKRHTNMSPSEYRESTY